MEWIEPVDVKSAVKFSSSLVNSTDEECRNIIHGSITGKKKLFYTHDWNIILVSFVSDSNLAWFACGDRLDVVSTTHSGVQSRHFQCPQGQEFQITCVAPIPNENLALVGLSSNTGSGAVALYNYVTSMILNSWMVSHKVQLFCSFQIIIISHNLFVYRLLVFVAWKSQMQVTSNFWNLTAFYLHLAQKRATLCCWPLTNISNFVLAPIN